MAEKRQICVEDTVHLKAKQWLIGVVDVSSLSQTVPLAPAR